MSSANKPRAAKIKNQIMKRFLTVTMLLIFTLSLSAFAQTQKESRKEKRARIEKMVKDGVAQKNLFIELTRLCPINGVAQNVVYGQDGYYIDIVGNTFTCNFPYIGNGTRVAYGNSETNMNINSNHQIVTYFGGWQDKDKCYRYQTIFWNDNKTEGVGSMQLTITIEIYTDGAVLASLTVPGKDQMSYAGEIVERLAGK